MPFRRLPDSKATLLTALTAAGQKAQSTAPALWLISAQQFSRYLDLAEPQDGQAGSVLWRFKKELGEEAGALAAQTPLTSLLDSTRGLLRCSISHFIQNINNAIMRGSLPREVRTLYNLPLESDRLPSLGADADLWLWSGHLIAGEAARVAAGGPPMAWPSAAELDGLRQELTERSAVQSTAKDRYDREQGDVERIVPEAAAAVNDLWDTIEFNLRQEPSNSSRRRRAREWGVVYALRAGETPLPEEDPKTQPPAAAPPAGPAPDA